MNFIDAMLGIFFVLFFLSLFYTGYSFHLLIRENSVHINNNNNISGVL